MAFEGAYRIKVQFEDREEYVLTSDNLEEANKICFRLAQLAEIRYALLSGRQDDPSFQKFLKENPNITKM